MPRDSDHEPDEKPRSGAAARPVRRILQKWGQATLTVVLSALTGVPAALASATLSLVPLGLAAWAALPSTEAMWFTFGVNALGGFLGLIAVAVILPALWGRVSNPTILRSIAYAAIQIVAISLGGFVPPQWSGWIITWAVASFGTSAWWLWQHRWRGAGVAPNPLMGVLRPSIHPGQIWYAVVHGVQETKIRPVLVLDRDPHDPHKWIVAYFTTREPKYAHLAAKYIPVPAGKLRGLSKDNWLSITDPRELSRGQFRSYTGVAPTWLYVQACQAHKMPANGLAITIDESAAGQGRSPWTMKVRRAIGLDKHISDDVDLHVIDIVRQLLHLPLQRRKPRP